MSRPAFVRTEADGGVRHVQLHRPERLNAVSDELYADLEPALQRVADDDVQARAWELALFLAEQPAISVALAKRTLGRAGDWSLDEALVAEAEGLLACMDTDDWSSGVQAFGARAGDGEGEH